MVFACHLLVPSRYSTEYTHRFGFGISLPFHTAAPTARRRAPTVARRTDHVAVSTELIGGRRVGGAARAARGASAARAAYHYKRLKRRKAVRLYPWAFFTVRVKNAPIYFVQIYYNLYRY